MLYARRDTPGVWLRRGAAEVQVAAALDPIDWGSFRLRGDTLYWYRRGDGAVVATPLDGGLERIAFRPAGRLPGYDPALDVSPDGRTLYFGQTDRYETDVRVVELR